LNETDKGIFSDYMHERIAVGDLIDVMGPSGAFTFSGEEADSVVLIGGGVGITPLMGAIRYLADIAWPGEIYLIYGARSTSEFIFRDELEHRQRRMPNLHVAATMARSAGTSWMGAEGPINREFLTQSVPDLTKRHIHLCGPPGMMLAMRTLLADLGVPTEQVKTEAFGPALGAVPPPGVTEVASVNGVNAAATAVSAIGPATASIRFSKSNKVAALIPDKSVLETAESAGVPIDFSCRAGICGVCKTRLLEGKVTMEVEEALTADDKVQGIILACQAKSIGNLVVEA
jgi:ferredoxin-NADP reductase